jgi:hypothetical protein
VSATAAAESEAPRGEPAVQSDPSPNATESTGGADAATQEADVEAPFGEAGDESGDLDDAAEVDAGETPADQGEETDALEAEATGEGAEEAEVESSSPYGESGLFDGGDMLESREDFWEAGEVALVEELRNARGRGGKSSGLEAQMAAELREAKKLANEERKANGTSAGSARSWWDQLWS